MTSMKARTTRRTRAKAAPAQGSKSNELRYEKARAEFLEMINDSDPFRRMREELEQYPVQLFGQICALYSLRQAPVPDYAVVLVPYLGEMSLRALEECGLVERSDRDLHAIRAFTPTDKGQELWGRMGRGQE